MLHTRIYTLYYIQIKKKRDSVIVRNGHYLRPSRGLINGGESFDLLGQGTAGGFEFEMDLPRPYQINMYCIPWGHVSVIQRWNGAVFFVTSHLTPLASRTGLD